MTEPRSEPDRIILAEADDPRDVVHRTVAILAQGGCVAVGEGSTLGVLASALQPGAVGALCATDEGSTGRGFLTLLLRGPGELRDWVPDLGKLGSRMARRAWPGPLAIVFSSTEARGLLRRLPEAVRSCLGPGETLALQVPAHPFVRDVLKLLPGPALFRTACASEGDEIPPPEQWLEATNCRLRIDTRPYVSDVSESVVRLRDDAWEVVRAGSIDATALVRMSGTIILFVCTGNTCRSPMAEALCKLVLAEHLGCGVGELESRGYVVLSAGIAATPGLPAAANAVDVVRARGGTLDDHASRKLTIDLVRQADVILTMTNDHLEALLEHVPEAGPKAHLLHPDGDDVADPVGSDRDTYRRTADAIEAYLRVWLPALVAAEL